MDLLFRRRARNAALRDVERLLRQYGPEAYRIAGEMAWRQDAGLLSAPADGHWHRVQSEIGLQTGQVFPTLDETVGRGPPPHPAVRSASSKPPRIAVIDAPASP